MNSQVLITAITCYVGKKSEVVTRYDIKDLPQGVNPLDVRFEVTFSSFMLGSTGQKYQNGVANRQFSANSLDHNEKLFHVELFNKVMKVGTDITWLFEIIQTNVANNANVYTQFINGATHTAKFKGETPEQCLDNQYRGRMIYAEKVQKAEQNGTEYVAPLFGQMKVAQFIVERHHGSYTFQVPNFTKTYPYFEQNSIWGNQVMIEAATAIGKYPYNLSLSRNESRDTFNAVTRKNEFNSKGEFATVMRFVLDAFVKENETALCEFFNIKPEKALAPIQPTQLPHVIQEVEVVEAVVVETDDVPF